MDATKPRVRRDSPSSTESAVAGPAPLLHEDSRAPRAAVPPPEPQDRRIREILRLIDTGRYEVLSLDVFDTLVWRMVPTPSDVFFLVARKLIERGAMRRSSSAASFVTERTMAEQLARRRRISHEVTLAEIYAEFARGYLLGITPQDVAAIEFETEKEIVRLHPEMPALIARARELGMRIALVSDTYFTSAQLRDLVGVDADRILASCEKRVGKYHGLHRSLIEEFGVAPQKILHVGDNYMADIEGPGLLDVERYWFRTFPAECEGMTDAELPKPLSRRAAFIETDDRGLTALRSRAIHAAESRCERWGAGVLGPMMAGFCDWVITRCRELEIETVLCLMREGRVLKGCLDAQQAPLDTREFYISRYAAMKSAILDASEDELMRYLFRPSARKRRVLLEQLGLDPGDGGDGDPEELIHPEDLRLIHRITASRELREKVIASSAAMRRGLLAHLASIAPRNGLVGIVDLGYRGTIQACCDRILEREGSRLRTHGLYFVTGSTVRWTQAGGSVAEGWLAENGQPIAVAQIFVRSPEIIEQNLMAECGSTIGYEATGKPILDEFRIPPKQRAEIAEIQKGTLAYASMWSAHKALHAMGSRSTESLKPFYEAICIRSIARPLESELDLFGSWKHDENFGSDTSFPLVDLAAMDEWEVSHISAHQIASLPHSRAWPFGFARRIDPRMGEAVTHIFLRTVEPEIFDSCDGTRLLAFYWDSGSGFRTEESKIHEYSLNNRGKVWCRFTRNLTNDRNRMIGFTIGVPGEVVQLTGAIIRMRPDDGTPTTLRIPHEEIVKEGYERIHGNLYLVKETPATFAIPTEGVEDFTGTIDVDLFFSVITVGGAS